MGPQMGELSALLHGNHLMVTGEDVRYCSLRLFPKEQA